MRAIAPSSAAASLLFASTLWAACGSAQSTSQGLLAVGTRAPDFAALDQGGQRRTLAEMRGHPVVLYFYPRDATPGCTREACAFRDAWGRLQATGARVVGVSTDDVASHRSFAAEHHLPFPLLADHAMRIVHAYGVPTNVLGMASRVTFLIDAGGVIARVYPDVDPGVHADEVLRDLAALR